MVVPIPSSGKAWLNKIFRWCGGHPYGDLTLAVLAMLGPFVAKPFNIDDPLFIWTARQIQAHPADPYGFDVNWYGDTEPMWGVTENPPLASYGLALAAKFLGWSEPALHAAFLLPALAVILGTYRLARRFCFSPMLAALATLCMPVFAVSSTTVMCDVLMLAFWVWAVVWWLEGLEGDDGWRLGGAGLLIALAVMTKYFGACLIPLLAAVGVMEKRRWGRWAAYLLIPLAAMGAYQWITWALYGHALLTDAMKYAGYAKVFFGFTGFASSLTALTFTGGCLAVVPLFTLLLGRTRRLAVWAGGTALIIGLLFHGEMFAHYPWLQGAGCGLVALQIIFWATGGGGVLALVLADMWGRRDAHSGLLGLWVGGVFLFTVFFNWTVNGRSLLPMAPAVGILLARRLEQTKLTRGKNWPAGVGLGLAAAGGLALLVTRADFVLATAVRQSAQQVSAKYSSVQQTLWYQGHWGFQFYMEALGASPFDIWHGHPKAGEFLAVPLNNASLSLPKPERASQVEVIKVPGPRRLTTWSGGAAGGFYAASRAPLPFAFNHVPSEVVIVYGWLPAPPPQ